MCINLHKPYLYDSCHIIFKRLQHIMCISFYFILLQNFITLTRDFFPNGIQTYPAKTFFTWFQSNFRFSLFQDKYRSFSSWIYSCLTLILNLHPLLQNTHNWHFSTTSNLMHKWWNFSRAIVSLIKVYRLCNSYRQIL